MSIESNPISSSSPSVPSAVQVEAIAASLAEVARHSLDVFDFHGNEPGDAFYDDMMISFCKAIRNRVQVLQIAYTRAGMSELAEDLRDREKEGCEFAAVLRLRRYHAPMFRILKVGDAGSKERMVAMAHEIDTGIRELRAHCEAKFCYDEYNYMVEDALLSAMVVGLRDLAHWCGGLLAFEEELRKVPLASWEAPAAREWLKTLTLPACYTVFESWCQTHKVDLSAEQTKAIVTTVPVDTVASLRPASTGDSSDVAVVSPPKDGIESLQVAIVKSGWKEIYLPGEPSIKLDLHKKVKRQEALKAIWDYCRKRGNPVFCWGDVQADLNNAKGGDHTYSKSDRFLHDVFKGQINAVLSIVEVVKPPTDEKYRLLVSFEER